jgi:uncharacterized membrane protein
VKILRLIVAMAAASLLLAAAAAPWMAEHGMGVAALIVEHFFHAVCHQRPERSLWLSGQPWAVCARCSGIYAGLAIGVLLSLEGEIAKRIFLAIASLNALDVATEFAGLHGSLLWLRLILGVGLGAATSALLCSRALRISRDGLCSLH